MTEKPFLLLQLRPEDEASHNEYDAFLKHGNLEPDMLIRVRLDQGETPPEPLDSYSGVIVGGGPYNVCDHADDKSPVQCKAEQTLRTLLDEIVERDFPYLGMCYGLGALAKHEGTCVTKERYAENVGGTSIILTDAGNEDKLTRKLPEQFETYTGHKESCQTTPASAVLLARSEVCPVQMIRVGENVYATQFHTELDHEGLTVRIKIYKHMGYFAPEDADDLIERTSKVNVHAPMVILRRFTDTYRRSS